MLSNQASVFISLLLLWFGHFFVDFMLGVWPVYKTIAELDLAVAGLIAATCAFVGEGMQIIFGSLSDRGFRKALILFGVVFTAANAFLGLTQSYTFLTIFFLCTCLGSGAFHPSAASLVGSLTETRKGLFIAFFASGGAAGMACSQIAFSYCFQLLSDQIYWIALPSLCLGSVLIFYGFYKKEVVEEQTVSRGKLQKFKEFFRNRNLRNLYINQVCNQTVAWGAIFLLPDVLVSRGYGDTIAYGGGHLAFVMGSALMMVPSGYLSDRFSAKSVMLFATIVGMLLFYAFLFMPEISNALLIPLLLVMGAAIGVVQPVAVAFGNQLCKKHSGAVSAFLMGLVWCVSETLGPAGGGLLTKLFSEDAPARALGVIGILFGVSIVTSSLLPKLIKEEDLFQAQETVPV